MRQSHIWLCHSVTASKYGTRVTLLYRGYGYGIATGRNFPDRTRTRHTRGPNTTGIPVPVTNPSGVTRYRGGSANMRHRRRHEALHQSGLDLTLGRAGEVEVICIGPLLDFGR
jgi:hypothetical protein